MSEVTLDQLNRPELLCKNHYINGEWVKGASASEFTVSDPATGQPFCSVSDSTPDDASRAVDAAYSAFTQWRTVSAPERARLLKRWGDLIIENRQDLARIMSREQGKAVAEALGEVDYGAAYLEWFAEQAVRVQGDVLPIMIPGHRQFILREPVGVVAAITPWNYPLAMITRKLGPAIAAGCTVVVKPSEETPLSALALAVLAEEAGIPVGVLNVVAASRETTPLVVKSWLDDARVRKITFTGSTAVGKHLAAASAGNLKRLSLELGGNAPFIVFEDANIDAAVAGLLRGKFRNSGQACVSPNRIFVHDSIFDEFATRLCQEVEKLVVGPATNQQSVVGPMINAKAIEKIDRHVRDAIDRGARLLSGGAPVQNELANGPYYYAPTILADATNDMVLSCEETFGPVIPLFRFQSEQDVIERANSIEYGLAAYYYTENAARIWRVADRLEAGIIGINEGVVAHVSAPVGGTKDSGYGREGSVHGLDDFLQMKYLCQGELD